MRVKDKDYVIKTYNKHYSSHKWRHSKTQKARCKVLLIDTLMQTQTGTIITFKNRINFQNFIAFSTTNPAKLKMLLLLLFAISVQLFSYTEGYIETREPNCQVLTDLSTYTDLGNGSVVFNGYTLPIIANTSEGDPVVCPPLDTLLPFHNYTAIFTVPGALFLPINILLNIVTIALYELLRCFSPKRRILIYDITTAMYNVSLILANFALLQGETFFQLAPTKIYCEHLAFYLHYILLAVFLCYLFNSLELARVSVQRRLTKRKERLLLAVYILISWVVPLIIIGINAAIYFPLRYLVLYGVTPDQKLKCWINQKTFSFPFFLGPLALVTLAIPFFIGAQVLGTILRQVSRRRRRRAYSSHRPSLEGNSTKSLIDFIANIRSRRGSKDKSVLLENKIPRKQQIFHVAISILTYLGLVIGAVGISLQISITSFFGGSHILILSLTIQSLTGLLTALTNRAIIDTLKDTFKSKVKKRKRESSSSSEKSESEQEDSRTTILETTSKKNKKDGQKIEDLTKEEMMIPREAFYSSETTEKNPEETRMKTSQEVELKTFQTSLLSQQIEFQKQLLESLPGIISSPKYPTIVIQTPQPETRPMSQQVPLAVTPLVETGPSPVPLEKEIGLMGLPLKPGQNTSSNTIEGNKMVGESSLMKGITTSGALPSQGMHKEATPGQDQKATGTSGREMIEMVKETLQGPLLLDPKSVEMVRTSGMIPSQGGKPINMTEGAMEGTISSPDLINK